MEAKTDIPGLYKTSEGYLINKDNEALKAYKVRKQKDAKVNELEQKIDSLSGDIAEIKNILKGLIK